VEGSDRLRRIWTHNPDAVRKIPPWWNRRVRRERGKSVKDRNDHSSSIPTLSLDGQRRPRTVQILTEREKQIPDGGQATVRFVWW
jgi:hypothetical protein